jgi:aldehyde:ferredoxin oxidoreductase
MLAGYAGKIGWVDLTEGTTRIDDLDEGMARRYIGGKAMGAYRARLWAPICFYVICRPKHPPMIPAIS